MKNIHKILATLLAAVFLCGMLSSVTVPAVEREPATSFAFAASYLDGTEEKKTTSLDNEAFDVDVTSDLDGMEAVLTPKRDITMKSLSMTTYRDFDENDRFFSNGYQSWAPALEHKLGDKTDPVIPAAKITNMTWQFAANISDYDFAKYGDQNNFHSWTMTYFRHAGSNTIDFYGSRSERNGFTLFDVDMGSGRFTIAKDIDGLSLHAGQKYVVFDIFHENGDYDKVFDDYFFRSMKFQKPKLKRMTGYTSWYNRQRNITEDDILNDLNALDFAKDQVSIFQIDDGFEAAVGDWTADNPKFPHGMKYLADKIHAKGYQAGIWLAPLVAQSTSKVVREHPDWLVRDDNGKLVIGNGGWGVAFVLDIYNPEVREYLRQQFYTVLNDWGYDMVKLDFLYAESIHPRNGKTRGEIMSDSVNFLREICGDKVILGCGVPIGSAMGVFDACRIGPDENANFEGDILNKMKITNEIPSTRNGMLNSLYRRFLNGRAFLNDTDVFYLRDGVQYTDEQKMLLAKINDMTGEILFMSDDASTYNEQQRNWLKHIYAPKTYKILSVERTWPDEMEVTFLENGVQKTLKFNLSNGAGNIAEVF